MVNEEKATYYEAVERHNVDHVYGVGDWYAVKIHCLFNSKA